MQIASDLVTKAAAAAIDGHQGLAGTPGSPIGNPLPERHDPGVDGPKIRFSVDWSIFRELDARKGLRIADAYQSMPHDPDNRFVAASYARLATEIMQQFRYATDSLEINIEPYWGDGEPYDNSREMRADVLRERHLFFLPTGQNFGSEDGRGAPYRDHPMLAPSAITRAGYRLLINDAFRAIHDIFGHVLTGSNFSPRGEERAWFLHSQMFSALARPALTTETRGQSCWVNFGPHMRNGQGRLRKKGEPGWLAPADRPFARQKAGLLPSSMSGVVLSLDAARGPVAAELLPGWSTESCLTEELRD